MLQVSNQHRQIMRVIRKLISKNNYWIIPSLIFTFLYSCQSTVSKAEQQHLTKQSNSSTIQANKQIKLALLLDTSSSMNGLINQAKSQLWEIVNELSAAKCEGQTPVLQIALYEYGNDGLSENTGYIRQVSELTTDLDVLSEKLFSLTTNGGSEYCGMVIGKAIKDIDWSDPENEHLKMIFIAGNEAFTQGPVAYESVCTDAKEKDIFINTIFCGNFNEGVNTFWKRGATLTNGEYMSIDHNQVTHYVATPYDNKIDQLNNQLNDTYIPYGNKGRMKKEQQNLQDNNASSMGKSVKISRAISKSKHVYKNDSWDLVDANKSGTVALEELDEEELPAEMQKMNTEERKDFVSKKSADRKRIQQQITDLSKKRSSYIADNQKKNAENSLNDAMLKSIQKQAKSKNYQITK